MDGLLEISCPDRPMRGHLAKQSHTAAPCRAGRGSAGMPDGVRQAGSGSGGAVKGADEDD